MFISDVGQDSSAGKEQKKCPPNQTKEEKTGNLPEKEFQIMIVKMIQNLEIKMESQINKSLSPILETMIEKMQESFNKDLEEIKKSQYIMNNAMLYKKHSVFLSLQIVEEQRQKIGLVN